MNDETIVPKLYQTSRGDRTIPLYLSILLAGSSLALAVASGPFLWPWGTLGALGILVGAGGALYRWRRAICAVAYDAQASTLTLIRGKRRRVVDCAALTRVEVRPSSVRTRLWFGRVGVRLSHRLVQVEELLSRLREKRPDLFRDEPELVRLRRSSASAWLQLLLASGTATAGVLMGDWLPGLGALFGVAAGYVVVRIAFFIPIRYEIRPGQLTTFYPLRIKRWRHFGGAQEAVYAAGGAEFVRLTLEFGRWKVVLDEGQLLDPVRPKAAFLLRLLKSPLPE